MRLYGIDSDIHGLTDPELVAEAMAAGTRGQGGVMDWKVVSTDP